MPISNSSTDTITSLDLRRNKVSEADRAVRDLIMLGQCATEDDYTRVLDCGEAAIGPLINILKNGIQWQRKVAMSALARIGEPAVAPLTEMMNSDNKEWREWAIPLLGRIGNEAAVQALAERLREEIETYRKNRRNWVRQRVAVYAAVLTAFVLWLAYTQLSFNPFLQIFVHVLLGGSFVDATVNLRRNTLAALSKVTDVRMVGPLALCLSDKDAEVRRLAADTLTRLLPQVKASDRIFLSAAEHEELLKALHGKNLALKLAILQALAQIGDERALPAVRRLAEMDIEQPSPGAWFLFGDMGARRHWQEAVALRRAAEDCLPFLQERAELSRQAHTLLRASSAMEAVAPDTLLRPAMGAPTTDTNQLLRIPEEATETSCRSNVQESVSEVFCQRSAD